MGEYFTTKSGEASYTTFITRVVDMGIVAPALIVVGALLLWREPLGYLLASMILVFTATIDTNLLAAGITQLLAGVVTVGQFIGFTVLFAILTLFSIWLTVVLFRNVSDVTTGQPVTVGAAHV
jgi:large-conductance mechanosensitive channel